MAGFTCPHGINPQAARFKGGTTLLLLSPPQADKTIPGSLAAFGEDRQGEGV